MVFGILVVVLVPRSTYRGSCRISLISFMKGPIVPDPVGRSKWTQPPRLLTIAIFLAAGSTVFFYELQTAQPINYVLPYSASFSALTALLAARIGLGVYRFVAEEGQRREWRHDQEVRYFEKIYAPLYIDTKTLVDSLRTYQLYWLGKWNEVKRSEFGPFVESKIAEALDSLQAQLDEGQKISNPSYNAAKRDVGIALEAYFGPDLAQASHSQIVDVFIQDQAFLFDPDKARPHEAYVDNLRNALRQQHLPDSNEAIDTMIRLVKEALLTEALIQKRVDICRAILPAAELLLARIQKRMKDPFES